MTPEPITDIAPVGPQYAVPTSFVESVPYPYINQRPYYYREAPVGYVSYDRLPSRNLHEKPHGYMLLPKPKDKNPPSSPPTPNTPGHWITINPGWGMPPVYGFLARETGLESEEGKTSAASKGHYVYVSKSSVLFDDAWAWVPEIDSSFGAK